MTALGRKRTEFTKFEKPRWRAVRAAPAEHLILIYVKMGGQLLVEVTPTVSAHTRPASDRRPSNVVYRPNFTSYRYRTEAFVGPWRDNEAEAISDAIRAGQAEPAEGEGVGFRWRVDGNIETAPIGLKQANQRG